MNFNKMKAVVEDKPVFAALRDELEKAKKDLYVKAYLAAQGNVVRMSVGLNVSRGTILKNLIKWFGKSYRNAIYAYSFTHCDTLKSHSISNITESKLASKSAINRLEEDMNAAYCESIF